MDATEFPASLLIKAEVKQSLFGNVEVTKVRNC